MKLHETQLGLFTHYDCDCDLFLLDLIPKVVLRVHCKRLNSNWSKKCECIVKFLFFSSKRLCTVNFGIRWSQLMNCMGFSVIVAIASSEHPLHMTHNFGMDEIKSDYEITETCTDIFDTFITISFYFMMIIVKHHYIVIRHATSVIVKK